VRSMEEPASPPTSMSTCPTCKRPVTPGSATCEACGTRMPALSTCSRCGTRFVTQVAVCELCGAAIICGEAGEPDTLMPAVEEEHAGPVDDQVTEPEGTVEYQEEDPGRDGGLETEEDIRRPGLSVSEDPQKTFRQQSMKPRHAYPKEIREPDTDALLEQFGSEYDENETLESSRTQKPGTDRDAAYFTRGKRYPWLKLPAAGTWIIGVFLVIAVMFAAAFFLGLPMLAGSGANTTHGSEVADLTPLPSPAGTIPPVPVTTPVPASGSLIPGPTQQVPAGQNFFFQVRKNPMTQKISVIFAGSSGVGGISSAAIRVTRPDLSVTTGTILPLEGVSEISLDGSGEADRVEIIVTMSSGANYRVYDGLVSP